MIKINLAFILLLLNYQALGFEIEYGLGMMNLNAPSYRGADSSTNFIFPFPYLKLKSKYLKIDRGGIKANIIEIKNLSLNLSIAGSAPAHTNAVKERAGMPKLDFSIEIGPSLVYALYQSKGGLFQLELPVRTVVATDLEDTQVLGYNFHPIFYYERDIKNIKTSFKLGRIYSSKGVNDYYYSVKQQFVTATRPFFDAVAGASSDMFAFTSSIKIDKHHWFALHFRYDDLSHNANKNSPLLKSTSNSQIAFIYAYIL